MPCTPWRRTSSATWKASIIVVSRASTLRSFSFGTTISVSTSALSASIPWSAWVPRRVPSNLNGLVTMPDRQRADVAREPRDHRRGAGAGAAADAGGDEDHVGALQQALDLVLLLEGRLVAELRVGARAEATRDAAAEVDGDVGGRLLQRLKVGVDGHELDAGDLRLDHAVDRVDAGAADADHADHRQVGARRAVVVAHAGLLAAVRGALHVVRSSAKIRLSRSLAAGTSLQLVDAVGADALGIRRRGLGLLRTARAPAAPRAAPGPAPASCSWSTKSGRLLGRRRLGACCSGTRCCSVGCSSSSSGHGGAEEIGERALAHAGPLTTRHSSGPPWPARGSTWRRCPSDRT